MGKIAHDKYSEHHRKGGNDKDNGPFHKNINIFPSQKRTLTPTSTVLNKG